MVEAMPVRPYSGSLYLSPILEVPNMNPTVSILAVSLALGLLALTIRPAYLRWRSLLIGVLYVVHALVGAGAAHNATAHSCLLRSCLPRPPLPR